MQSSVGREHNVQITVTYWPTKGTPKVSNHLYICVFTVALSPGPNNIACVCCAGSCLCSVFGYFNLSEICEFKP